MLPSNAIEIKIQLNTWQDAHYSDMACFVQKHHCKSTARVHYFVKLIIATSLIYYINGHCFKFARGHKNVAKHAHLVY